MRKVLSTLAAATAGLGLMVGAPSAAHAFIAPAVVAAWAAGAALTGLFVGAAATNANNNAVVATAPAAVVTPAPAVTVGSTTCYFTHAWVNHERRRVQVCNNY